MFDGRRKDGAYRGLLYSFPLPAKQGGTSLVLSRSSSQPYIATAFITHEVRHNSRLAKERSRVRSRVRTVMREEGLYALSPPGF